MNFPAELKYSKDDEWVMINDDASAVIGITDYAQDQLGDIVFINLPMVGDPVNAGAPMCDIESVKAVADVISPVTAELTEVNQALESAPELLNDDPYANWIAKVSGITGFEDLMSAEEYKAYRQIVD